MDGVLEVIFTVATSNEHVQPLYKKREAFIYAKKKYFIICRPMYIFFHTHVHIYTYTYKSFLIEISISD
jgi:hypothetical protein